MTTNKEPKKLAIVIGRFQPFHNMHQRLIRKAAGLAKNTIVLVGSSLQARNTENPFSFTERKEMISLAMGDKVQGIFPLVDHYYDENDSKWIAQVQEVVSKFCKENGNIENKDIVLVGFSKDNSSYYLKLFPQWGYETITSIDPRMNATNLRGRYFHPSTTKVMRTKFIAQDIPPLVLDYLIQYAYTEDYESMVNEFKMISEYRESWKAAPYKPTFVTTDAVVVCSGHVLMVVRKHAPGKGLFALPGGFLNQEEKIVDGIIRELKEETGISLGGGFLKNAISKIEVFDSPKRSQRGRTITHAALISLNMASMPEVQAADDAEDVVWLTFEELAQSRERVFEDHAQIISKLTGVTI